MSREWRHRIKMLKVYYDCHKTYPLHCPDTEGLGVWLQQQITAYKKGLLSEEKCQLLESLPEWKVGIPSETLSQVSITEESSSDEAESKINIERALQKTIIERFLKSQPSSANGGGWILYAQEYTVIPFMCNMGKGDIVFMHKESGRIHIIECKKHKPIKTQNQARYYAAWWKLQNPDKRVTYQSVTLMTSYAANTEDAWSALEDMDLNDAGFILLKKFSELQGLNDKEIKTVSMVFTNLFVK